MEESFVMLLPTSTSVYKYEFVSEGSETRLSSPEEGPSGHLQPNNSGFHTTITVLKRAFDIATTQIWVEPPLCLECCLINLTRKLKMRLLPFYGAMGSAEYSMIDFPEGNWQWADSVSKADE